MGIIYGRTEYKPLRLSGFLHKDIDQIIHKYASLLRTLSASYTVSDRLGAQLEYLILYSFPLQCPPDLLKRRVSTTLLIGAAV